MKKGIDLSNLPSNWHVAELGNHLERIANGLTVTQNPEPPGLPVSRIETISDGTINFDRVRYVQGLDREKQKQFLLRQGDILFSHINSDLHLGKTAVYSSIHPLLHGMNLLLLRTRKESLHPYYLHYLLNYYRREGKFIEIAQHAVNQSSLNQKKIVSIPIPVAPLDQQQHIVAEIEKQFSRLDEAVANLKRVKANLKRYKAAVLKAAVEGKLTEDWRKQHLNVEPASKLLDRILAERREKWRGRGKYKEPAALEISNLPFLPEGWGWASPEQLSSAEAYSFAIGPFGSNLKVSDYTDTGVPLIFVRNIRSLNFGAEGRVFVSKTKAAELKAHKVSGRDVLVTKMGAPPGDACLYPESASEAIITADCIKLRLSQLIPEKLFIVHALNSEVVKTQILAITKGVAQMKVSLARFSGIAIPFPPQLEQKRIVAEVERRLSVIDEVEATVEANLTRADRLRQSVLSEAFSGRLLGQDTKHLPDILPTFSIAAESQARYGRDDRTRQ